MDNERRLGSANPVISTKDNRSWVFDQSSKLWRNIPSGTTRTVYPGKPLPVPEVTSVVKPFFIRNEKWFRIVIGRLSKKRNTVGFGNARAVWVLLDQVKKFQTARLVEQGLASVKVEVKKLL